MAKETQSEDTAKRFEAIGFDVETVDGHDMEAFLAAFERARVGERQAPAHHRQDAHRQGDPRGRRDAEGARRGGRQVREAARKGLGLPERLSTSPRGERVLRRAAQEPRRELRAWTKTFDAWRSANPALARARRGARIFHPPASGPAPKSLGASELLSAVPEFAADTKIATRKAGQDVLQPLAARVPCSSEAAPTSTARRSTTSAT
jgi:transketolase